MGGYLRKLKGILVSNGNYLAHRVSDLNLYYPAWLLISKLLAVIVPDKTISKTAAIASANICVLDDQPDQGVKMVAPAISSSKNLSVVTPDKTASKTPAIASHFGMQLTLEGAVADDGGVQTDETVAANNATANDMTLLPAVPAVNDAYYFGGSPTKTVYVPGSDKCNGGTVTASGENPPNETKEKAFDNNFSSSKWLTFSSSGWITYDFGAGNAWTIQYYTITSGNDASERDPKNWTLEGSNNGTDWTTLDTRTNESWGSRLQTRAFSFSNSTAYRYIKLNISAVQSGSVLQIEEIEYMEATTATSPGQKFNRVWLNIGTNGQGNWSTVEEYWNGASWASCTTVADTISNFMGGSGLRYYEHIPQSDWATCAVKGITAYWLRFRVNSYTSITTQPKGTQAWTEVLV